MWTLKRFLSVSLLLCTLSLPVSISAADYIVTEELLTGLEIVFRELRSERHGDCPEVIHINKYKQKEAVIPNLG